MSNNRYPKYDIRSSYPREASRRGKFSSIEFWEGQSADHEKMGKGVILSKE